MWDKKRPSETILRQLRDLTEMENKSFVLDEPNFQKPNFIINKVNLIFRGPFFDYYVVYFGPILGHGR